MAKSEPIAFPHPKGLPVTHWFSARGSVVRRGATSEVFVGGTLVGSFEADEPLARNAILVQLSEDPRCHLGRLAEAFDISTERLRQLRRLYEQGGIEALRPGESGSPRRLSARDALRLERLFEQGLRPAAAHAKVKGASRATIVRSYRVWRDTRAAERVAPLPADTAESRTMTLPGVEMLPTVTAPRGAGCFRVRAVSRRP